MCWKKAASAATEQVQVQNRYLAGKCALICNRVFLYSPQKSCICARLSMNYYGLFRAIPILAICAIMACPSGMNGQMKKVIWARYMASNGGAGKPRMKDGLLISLWMW